MKDLSGLEIHDYFRILWNRRWYALIVFALISIGGTFYARMKLDFYSSEVRIAVETPLSAVSRSAISVNERIDIIREQLLSRSFLERMVQQTGAYGFGTSNDFVMERALNSIRKSINVQSSRGRTFTISYRSTDPQMAQNVTRQFSDELIRASKISSENRFRTVDRFADQMAGEAEKKVKEISERIRDFKQKNAGTLPEQSISNANALSGYQSQLNTIDNAIQRAKDSKDSLDNQYEDTKQLRSQMEQIQASSSGSKPVITRDSSPEEIELAQKTTQLLKYEATLQTLAKYTEQHPDVVATKREIGRLEQDIEELREKIQLSSISTDEDGDATPPLTLAKLQEERFEKNYADRRRSIEADIEKLEKNREGILKAIAEYESRLKIAPTLEQDLADLMREQAIIQREYENYAAQKLKAGMDTAVETDRENEIYRVIDEANFPIYPETSRKKVIIMGILGGLVMGIASAFGRELIDSTIGSEEEAKKIFQLPVLAAIPAAPKKNKKTELRKIA